MQTQANKMSQNMFLVIDARKCDGYELKTRSSFAFCLVCDLVRWWLADCFNGTLYWHLIHLSCFFALFESNACIVNVFSRSTIQLENLKHLKLFFYRKERKKKKHQSIYLVEHTLNSIHFHEKLRSLFSMHALCLWNTRQKLSYVFIANVMHFHQYCDGKHTRTRTHARSLAELSFDGRMTGFH